jgi:rare lipoprotein A (peptidoglycan hydrolase)
MPSDPPNPPRRPARRAVLLALLLAGCAGPPGKRGDRTAHAELLSVPDAQPRIEALRPGGPNKPYAVLGRSYTPQTTDVEFQESGLASWYGNKFHGQPTASGERYDMHAMTAAHPTMPIPSYARVRNPANGRSVIVRINDRGPFSPGRIIDLSLAAAVRLGVSHAVSPVEVERLTHEAIRSGDWRR